MPKGSASRFRPGGNGRAGLRDTPPGLGALAAEQRAGEQAQREMRSRAAKDGHKTRRANEAARLVDELTDRADDDAALAAHWDTLSDRQREFVSRTLEAEEARAGKR
jgi:hypothetical protein